MCQSTPAQRRGALFYHAILQTRPLNPLSTGSRHSDSTTDFQKQARLCYDAYDASIGGDIGDLPASTAS